MKALVQGADDSALFYYCYDPVPAPWAGNGGPCPPCESLVPALDEPAEQRKRCAIQTSVIIYLPLHCEKAEICLLQAVRGASI